MKVQPAPDNAIINLDLKEAAALDPHAVLARLDSRPEGLTTLEATQRLATYGLNVLAVHRVRASVVLWRQLRNPILILLLGAALVSGLTGGGTNAIIIAVIVVLSVGLGFVNEFRAAVAMSSLRSKISQNATVLRDGVMTLVPVTTLVPGDVIKLELGELVPADVRFLSADQCECDEGVTGESLPVEKTPSSGVQGDGSSFSDCACTGGAKHVFLLLFGMVAVYLVLVEAAKVWFFRHRSPHLAGVTRTHAQRLERRIFKRASQFISHEGPVLH